MGVSITSAEPSLSELCVVFSMPVVLVHRFVETFQVRTVEGINDQNAHFACRLCLCVLPYPAEVGGL